MRSVRGASSAEEHVLDDRLADAPDAGPGTVGPLVRRPAERLVHLALVVQGHARLHPRAGEAVEHADLVLEHHQRDDVAVRRRIEADRQPVLQVDHVHAVGVVHLFGPSCVPSQIMLPMCFWRPLVPVTYQPPQRSASGLA